MIAVQLPPAAVDIQADSLEFTGAFESEEDLELARFADDGGPA